MAFVGSGQVGSSEYARRRGDGRAVERAATSCHRRTRVPKKAEPERVSSDFVFASDRELDEQIAAHRTAHEQSTGQRLAMHARRSLGAGKVRITFRIVDAPAGGKRKR